MLVILLLLVNNNGKIEFFYICFIFIEIGDIIYMDIVSFVWVVLMVVFIFFFLFVVWGRSGF